MVDGYGETSHGWTRMDTDGTDSHGFKSAQSAYICVFVFVLSPILLLAGLIPGIDQAMAGKPREFVADSRNCTH